MPAPAREQTHWQTCTGNSAENERLNAHGTTAQHSTQSGPSDRRSVSQSVNAPVAQRKLTGCSAAAVSGLGLGLCTGTVSAAAAPTAAAGLQLTATVAIR